MLTKPISRDMHRNGGHLNCKSFSEYNEHLIPMPELARSGSVLRFLGPEPALEVSRRDIKKKKA